jgi:uncharacterized membrane protein HdeD (DUF308 family)
MVLGGVLALVYPIVSSVAVVLFLGWVLIISGVVQGISLIGAQHVPHFWLQLISVALSVIVGVLFVRQPGEGLLAITLLLIVFFMVEGISKLASLRPDHTAFSKLGLGFSKRRHRDTAVPFSVGQSSGDGNLVAWRPARHSSHL